MELLADEGITEDLLVEQCRVPYELFRIVTSRTPVLHASTIVTASEGPPRKTAKVTSLLEYSQRSRQNDNESADAVTGAPLGD